MLRRGLRAPKGPGHRPPCRAAIDPAAIWPVTNESVLRRGFRREGLRSISLSTGRRNSIFIPSKVLFAGRPSFLWKLLRRGRRAGVRTWREIIFSKPVKREHSGFLAGSEATWGGAPVATAARPLCPGGPVRAGSVRPAWDTLSSPSSGPSAVDGNLLRAGPQAS